MQITHRGRGVSGKLLSELKKNTSGPALVGIWKAAVWAIRFYEKYEYRLVTEQQKEQLLRKYWKIPERQVETSVVLANGTWFSMSKEKTG